MTDTVNVPREAWGEYKRSQIAHLRPYIVGETLSERVSISMADLEAGSPKDGDMIARNPANHDDQWLVAADYFAANFEPALLAAAPKAEPVGGSIAEMVTELVNETAPDQGQAPSRAFALALSLQAFLASQPKAPKVEQEPVAYVSRKGFTTGGLVWTKEGRDADLPDETKLYTHPAPASELLEALAPFARYYDLNDCHERRPDDALEVPIYDLARAAELIAKHKGPQS